MAKILPCYSLCPLIEQKNFLGLTKDADLDTVLVTANSNIIGRYKISDPKQISSWNSKGSITSATVYDEFNGQYVAIFNNNEIRMWTSVDESIDKVKKYKFSEKLLGLLISPDNGKILVVFKNGNVLYLDKAIDLRKNLLHTSLIKDEQVILFDVAYISETLITIFLISSPNKSYRIFGTSIDKPDSAVFDIRFKNNNFELLGHSLLIDKNCYLISMWSNGKIYKDSLFPNADEIPTHYLNTIDDISLTNSIVLKMMSPYHIAICGSKDDGIVLIIYSVKYNLVQCKQFYENCSSSPQLWNFESKLFLIMGHNLVVVPYVQENQKLSTLIGLSVHQFDSEQNGNKSDADICNQLLPQLIEKEDYERILKVIRTHCDIPDRMLIQLLVWSLKQKETRETILNIILYKYCIVSHDISSLRSFFTVDESLELVEYIMDSIPRSDDNFKLFKWASLLIDAFYQQYIMSDNDSILKKLNMYLIVLKAECDYLNELKDLASVASCIKRRKIILNQ